MKRKLTKERNVKTMQKGIFFLNLSRACKSIVYYILPAFFDAFQMFLHLLFEIINISFAFLDVSFHFRIQCLLGVDDEGARLLVFLARSFFNLGHFGRNSCHFVCFETLIKENTVRNKWSLNNQNLKNWDKLPKIKTVTSGQYRIFQTYSQMIFF